MNEERNSKFFQFLQRMDCFGVGININYNKETKFKTRFGGFITLVVGILLAVLLFSSFKQIIHKTNPKVLQEQKIVNIPSRYNLNKKNFSIAIALTQAVSYKILNDETVFRVEADFYFKQRSVNPDGSLGTPVYKSKPIELEKCNQASFQVESTQEYFLSLPYQNMYCMKNYDELYLVGQYELEDFSLIQFKIIPCNQSDPKNKVQCIDVQKQNEILRKTNLYVYYSNGVVQASSYQQPIKSIGQYQFWKTNVNLQQTITLQYINTFVQDDEGLFFQDIKTTNSLLFSQDRSMISSDDDLAIFKIAIFLERNKEQYYYRQYLKIQNIISEIGGIYNVLFFIGILIAQPYSKMQLHRQLFNQTFLIVKKQQNKNSMNQKDNNNQNSHFEKSEENQQQKENNNVQLDQMKSLKCTQTEQIKLKQGQIDVQQLKISDIFQNSPKNQKRNDRITTLSKYNQSELKDTIKSSLTQLKIKTCEIILYYFNCFKIFKSDMIEMLDFGSQQIKNFTDINFIVNKLLEIEKLKHILLNDEQIKLFEFIPKPKLDQEIIQINQLQILNEQQKQLPNHMQNILNPNKVQQQEITQQATNSFTLLSMKNQPIQEKAKQAQSAFNKIFQNQNKKSKIDIKLISMLDEKLLKLLNCNAFDELSLDKNILSSEKISLQGQIKSSDSIRKTKNMNLKLLSKEMSQISPKYFCPKLTEINDVHDHEVYDDDVNETSEGLKLYEQRPKQLIQNAEIRNRIISLQQSDIIQIDNSHNTDDLSQQQNNILDPINQKYINQLFQV